MMNTRINSNTLVGELDIKKQQLRKELMSFFRQRKRAALELNDLWLKSQIETLIIRFNLIQSYDYWRHCREVNIQKNRILVVLPSSNGKHLSIRERIIALIDQFIAVANSPRP